MILDTQHSSSKPLELPSYLRKAFEQKDLSVFIDTKERLLRILSGAIPYTHNSTKDREIHTENLTTLNAVKEAMLLLERGDSTLH